MFKNFKTDNLQAYLGYRKNKKYHSM